MLHRKNKHFCCEMVDFFQVKIFLVMGSTLSPPPPAASPDISNSDVAKTSSTQITAIVTGTQTA